MNEATIIKTLDLPPGQDWILYSDANVIVLASRLDPCERDRALDEVCAHWRRSRFTVVPAAAVLALTGAAAALAQVHPVPLLS